jgi:hypothetical protein
LSKVGRNSFVEKLGTNIVTPPRYREQIDLHARLRERNKAIDRRLTQKRAQWVLHPPENMNLFLIRDCGEIPAGLVVSVCARVGASLLARRAAHIFASENAIADVVLSGEYEDVAAGLGL